MKDNSGFSLLEMVVVVSIVLIISAIGVLHYVRQRAGNAVTVSVQIVASDLKLAKDTASTSSNGAEIDIGVPVSGGTSVVIKLNGTIIRQDSLPSPATLQTSWGNNVILFQQNGSTTSFASNGIITISCPGTSFSKRVQVVPYTGAILQ